MRQQIFQTCAGHNREVTTSSGFTCIHFSIIHHHKLYNTQVPEAAGWKPCNLVTLQLLKASLKHLPPQWPASDGLWTSASCFSGPAPCFPLHSPQLSALFLSLNTAHLRKQKQLFRGFWKQWHIWPWSCCNSWELQLLNCFPRSAFSSQYGAITVILAADISFAKLCGKCTDHSRWKWHLLRLSGFHFKQRLVIPCFGHRHLKGDRFQLKPMWSLLNPHYGQWSAGGGFSYCTEIYGRTTDDWL